MTIPFDQRLAKLRILCRRANTFYEAQKRAYDSVVAQAYEPVRAADSERVRVFSEYMDLARELGYCGNCEKLLDQCQCVWMARAESKAKAGTP